MASTQRASRVRFFAGHCTLLHAASCCVHDARSVNTSRCSDFGAGAGFNLKLLACFVDQLDSHLPLLTVKETVQARSCRVHASLHRRCVHRRAAAWRVR